MVYVLNPNLDSSICDQCQNVCSNMSYDIYLKAYASFYEQKAMKQEYKNILYEKFGGIMVYRI